MRRPNLLPAAENPPEHRFPGFAIPLKRHYWSEWLLMSIEPHPKLIGKAWLHFVNDGQETVVFGLTDGRPILLSGFDKNPRNRQFGFIIK